MQAGVFSQTASFRSAIPVLTVNDLPRSLALYSQIGFEVVHQDNEFAIIKRDLVELHLTLNQIPALDNLSSCRINVTNIEVLYQQCLAANVVHPNAPLKEQPWSLKEFAILDASGVCITFAEPLTLES